MRSVPALLLLLLIAIGAVLICAADHDVTDPMASDAASGSDHPPSGIGVDVTESGSFGIVFFGEITSFQQKSQLVAKLNQTPDLPISYESVSVLDNIQHANGNQLVLINMPDFGIMLMKDARAQIMQFHELNPQFSSRIPIARIYFVTSVDWTRNAKIVRGGLELIRDLYGVDVAHRIQFIAVERDSSTQLQALYSGIFPSFNMLPVIYLDENLEISPVLQDIHSSASQSTSLYLEPAAAPSPSSMEAIATHIYISESRNVSNEGDDDADLVLMSIGQIRAVQHLCHYARLCLKNHEAKSGECRIPVSRHLQLLYDICDVDVLGRHFSAHAIQLLNEADTEIGFGILQAFSFLGVDAPIMDVICNNCRPVLFDAVLFHANISADAIHEYLQATFPEENQPDLLSGALLDEECGRAISVSQMENLILALPESAFMDLIVNEAGNLSRMPYTSKLEIILRRFSTHRPDTVPPEFIDLLLRIAKQATPDAAYVPASDFHLPSLPRPDQVRSLLQLITHYSSNMPDYLHRYYRIPSVDFSCSPWQNLVGFLDGCTRFPNILTPEFLNSILPDLILIREHADPNFKFVPIFVLAHARGQGFLWLLDAFSRDPTISVDIVGFRSLFETIIAHDFSSLGIRSVIVDNIARCRDADISMEILFFGLSPERAVDLFQRLCHVMNTQIKVAHLWAMERYVVNALIYVHESHPEQVLQECLTHVTTQAEMPWQSAYTFALVHVQYLHWQWRRNGTGVGFDAFRELLLRRPDIVALENQKYGVRQFLENLITESLPSVYPYLILAGNDGVTLYRELEQNLTVPTRRAIRHAAGAILEPGLWLDFYQDEIVSDIARHGLGQYVEDLTRDLDEDRSRRLSKLVLWMLVRSGFQEIPRSYMEGLLNEIPDPGLNMEESDYIRCYWYMLDLHSDLDWHERPLTLHLLDHARLDFFAQLCASAQDVAAAPDQKQQRLDFCTQLLHALIERNPVKAAHLFALPTCDANLLAPVLRELLQCISRRMSPGPVFPGQALGDWIVSVYQSLGDLTEPPHPNCWAQWVTLMLPATERFPMEHVTPRDLAFEAILGFHPDHAVFLRDLLSRLRAVDFNRVRNCKSILGELLFALNQWHEALGLEQIESILRPVVERTTSWSVVFSDSYLDRLRSDLSHVVKTALDSLILSFCIDISTEWAGPDRHALAAVLFITSRRSASPDTTALRSLLAICALLRLQLRTGPGPTLTYASRQPATSSFDLSVDTLYPCAVFEILLQLIPESETLRLTPDDLISGISECINSMPDGPLDYINGLSPAYGLLQRCADFRSGRVRDLIEAVVSRILPYRICAINQEECILDLIQSHAESSKEDPDVLQWLDQIKNECSVKIAAAGARHCCEIRRQVLASDPLIPDHPGRVDTVPNHGNNDGDLADEAADDTDAANAQPEPMVVPQADLSEVHRPNPEEHLPAPEATSVDVEHFEQVPVDVKPSGHDSSGSSGETSSRRVAIVVISCSAAGASILAIAVLVWYRRLSYAGLMEKPADDV